MQCHVAMLVSWTPLVTDIAEACRCPRGNDCDAMTVAIELIYTVLQDVTCAFRYNYSNIHDAFCDNHNSMIRWVCACCGLSSMCS